MENDITLCFLKYLLKNDIIDIKYLENLDESEFIGSNIHKLITHLSVNYINIKSEIQDEKLSTLLRNYRNSFIHTEGSVNKKKFKFAIISILNIINNMININEYNEYDYMIY